MRRPHPIFAGFHLLLSIGLGCSDGAGGGGGSGPSPPPSSAGPVTGTLIDTYCTDSGTVDSPRVGTVLTAVVADSDGTLREVSATVDMQGAFSLPGIPTGPYLLRGAADKVLVTQERRLELGTNRRGRPDAVAIHTSPTYLQFLTSGLLPVTPTHFFSFLSVGGGLFGAPTFDMPPSPGSTGLDGARTDVAKFVNPHLVDPSRGDRAYLMQLERSPTLTRVVSVFEPGPFVQEDGKETVLSGSFQEVTAEPVRFMLDRAAFDAVRPPSEPPPGFSPTIVSVIAAPSDGSECMLPAVTANAFFRDLPDTITLDVGSPFRNSWPLVVMVRPGYDMTRIMNLPVDGPIGPVASAVRDLRVNDQSVADDLAGVGTTPTISFSRPDVGSADWYAIDIVQIHVPGVEGGVVSIAQVVTYQTSVTLPAGLLQPGAAYAFHVKARAGGTADAPYRTWKWTGYGEAGGVHTREVRP